MTVSDAIIKWLLTYDKEVESINTDMVSASTASFALTKEPIVNEKHYLSGKVEKTAYYQFTARLDTQTNADRRDNDTWLENLEKWVRNNKKQGKMPKIPNAEVKDVFVSTSYYLGQTAEDTSLYSLTIGIKFTM